MTDHPPISIPCVECRKPADVLASWGPTEHHRAHLCIGCGKALTKKYGPTFTSSLSLVSLHTFVRQDDGSLAIKS